jgi:hypothetical protein
MGTGLLAPFYRAARRLSAGAIRDDVGVLTSVAGFSEQRKSALATASAYRARSEIALDVACAYPGGDYFEFGSAGLGTFRSFIAAFDINSGHTKHFPGAKFWAFDIFGNPDHGGGAPAAEHDYFEAWRGTKDANDPELLLTSYGALKDRCVLVPGYYQETLNEALKEKLRAEKRSIGFAFLDCNIVSSYKLVFDFLLDVIGSGKMYVYIDEYFTDPPVAALYEEFAEAAMDRHALRSIYMRNAASFGALFCLMPLPR